MAERVQNWIVAPFKYCSWLYGVSYWSVLIDIRKKVFYHKSHHESMYYDLFCRKINKFKKPNKYMTSGHWPKTIMVGGQQPNCTTFLEFEAHTIALENSKACTHSSCNIFNTQVPIKYSKILTSKTSKNFMENWTFSCTNRIYCQIH